MTRYASYVICTAPRSGSTMLCRLLAATGLAGRPEAYFHRSLSQSLAGALKTPLDPTIPHVDQAKALIQAVVTEGRGDNDIFGMRLQGHSLAFFLKTLAEVCPDQKSSAERIAQNFGPTRFLYLNRFDKVGQALSYVRAQQSGLWHKASDGTEIERLSPPREPVYDFSQIFAVYQEMQAYDRTWRAWFDTQGITPHVIRYEDLSANPSGTLREFLSAIDRPTRTKMPEADTMRLSDELTQNWRERFLDDLDRTGLA